ncbi:aldehyde dehydrogenase family protein [Pseudomonas sp. DCB_AW]|uniref:aldehyde dehydrogenase family protein n=1 Tax=Pseudomonas sp. DCB_AW TaxID=2993596 RepID=UPI00224949CF|nr:aldehyde dehydrogenase family protein [Pseudomonas sp. DCB_AW]MCX2684652.1 aldehyde dehydrogenase family protein [Pseudomonas sp. DCB_AW]
MEVQRNLIGGEWVSATETFESRSPSDVTDLVGIYSAATVEDVQRAIAAARDAQPSWASTTIQVRSDLLQRISTEILSRKEELGELVSREAGKTRAEGIGEVTRAGQVFHYFAGEALRMSGQNIPSTRPNIGIMTSREPVGVIGLITPWNFPIAIASWKLAPALAYGNTVVLKPSQETPGIATEVFKIMERCGLPKGVANLVNGPGRVTGNALLDGIDALSFTGSVPTGRQLAEIAGQRMIRIQLELGGKNPLIVLDDADLDTAVECAVNGAFFSAGQRCTASSRFIVTEKIHDRFVEGVCKRMQSLRVGPALEKTTDIGPVISEKQLQMIEHYIEVGKGEGAELAHGGHRLELDRTGHYMQPTLFTHTHGAMRINQEEIFGPFASVIRVTDYEEALQVANNVEFGLSAGICTQSHRYATDFRLNSKSGLVMVNLPTAGIDYHVPLNGTKSSSFGSSEQGERAIDFYTRMKTAYVSHH